ncbi:MAG TPA: LuxR C-terminal-related transcriptional regulator [Lentimicrobium sp.]|nr:LuxR C-terminal-related transcriptional regulator [Lentimicrobium sp.]
MIRNEMIIALLGLPDLISEGISNYIQQLPGSFTIRTFSDPSSLNVNIKDKYALIIFDASMLQMWYKQLNNVRKEHNKTALIAIQYQLINQSLLNICDKVITIDQSEKEIIDRIGNSLQKYNEISIESKLETLSDRETDVLKLLVNGLSGKEIADKLNISVNTVITHRKNISQKTGIKSLAGLTIYAVTNRIISMSNL